MFNFYIKKIIRKLKGKLNYPPEATSRDIEIISTVLKPQNKKEALSMLTVDKLFECIQTIKYLENNKIDGDIIECGVWRGGCSLAMKMVLNDFNSQRKLILIDTFDGMTEPSNWDINFRDNAINSYKKFKHKKDDIWMCYASLESVKNVFKKYKLNKNVSFLKGDVMETLKNDENIPERIALLRLDTDWYESTKFEMERLYPKLTRNGVLLIDDYGLWDGQRKAVDEYFEINKQERPYKWITDYAGRGYLKI